MNSRIVLVQSGEGEVVITLVFLPFLGDFSSSPEPHSVNFVVALNSVYTVHSETVFSEVVNVSEVAVLEVVGQVADDTLTLVFDVVNFPEGPSSMVELTPKLGKGRLLVLSVAELAFPIIDVKG